MREERGCERERDKVCNWLYGRNWKISKLLNWKKAKEEGERKKDSRTQSVSLSLRLDLQIHVINRTLLSTMEFLDVAW